MRWAGILVLLAGCAAPADPPEARVDQVILYRETVNVLMSDGTLCVSDRPGRAARWSGTLNGCPHPRAIVVTGLTAAPRRVLQPGGSLVIVDGAGWG